MVQFDWSATANQIIFISIGLPHIITMVVAFQIRNCDFCKSNPALQNIFGFRSTNKSRDHCSLIRNVVTYMLVYRHFTPFCALFSMKAPKCSLIVKNFQAYSMPFFVAPNIFQQIKWIKSNLEIHERENILKKSHYARWVFITFKNQTTSTTNPRRQS